MNLEVERDIWFQDEEGIKKVILPLIDKVRISTGNSCVNALGKLQNLAHAEENRLYIIWAPSYRPWPPSSCICSSRESSSNVALFVCRRF